VVTSPSKQPTGVVGPLRTKFEPLTPPRSRVRSKKLPKSPFLDHFWTPPKFLYTSLTQNLTLLLTSDGLETFRLLNWVHFPPAEPIRSGKSQKLLSHQLAAQNTTKILTKPPPNAKKPRLKQNPQNQT